MSKVIFIGGVLPDGKLDEIIENSIGNIDFAAHNFQKKLINGFLLNDVNLEVISVPFISSYPKYYKKKTINFINNDSINYLKYNNLPYIKLLSRYFSLKKFLKKAYKKYQNEDVNFIIYSLHYPFLRNSFLIKRKFKNAKITLIVPDLLEYMSDSKSIVYKYLKKIEILLANKCIKNIDSFVFLTKYMNEKINKFNKPYTIIEGISNFEINEFNENLLTPTDKYVLYTGTLASRYGVKTLVDAYNLLDKPNYKLYICGNGDSYEYIKEASLKNNNIVFLGQVSPSMAKLYQKNAFALVNPRQNNEEYTKYSFPSKILEYVSTGKPVICYKLDGFPDEYDDVLIYPIDNDPQSLAKCMDEVLNFTENKLSDIKEKSFKLTQEKTPKKMVDKILKQFYQ